MGDSSAHHPGLTTWGAPNAIRYLCPFCDWFYDRPRLQWATELEVVLQGHIDNHIKAMSED